MHAQSCLTLCDIMDCIALQAPLSKGILQTKILEWIAIRSSRGSSQPRDQTHDSYISWIGWWVFHHYHHLGIPTKTYTCPQRVQESLVDTHRNASNILHVPKSHEQDPGLHIAFILLQNGNKCWITNVLKNNSWEWLLHKNISTQSFADGSTCHKKGVEELK